MTGTDTNAAVFYQSLYTAWLTDVSSTGFQKDESDKIKRSDAPNKLREFFLLFLYSAIVFFYALTRLRTISLYVYSGDTQISVVFTI